MRSRWLLLLLPVLILRFDGAASAEALDQQRCFGPPAGGKITQAAIDDRISGCTAIIQAGQETPQNLAKAYRSRGYAYVLYTGQSGAFQDYYRGIRDFDDAIRLEPNNAGAFDTRGLGYLATGQYERAIWDFDQAIQLAPQLATIFHNRAVAYSHNGQYDRAIEDLDQAIRLDPQFAEAYHQRGIVKRLRGASAEADEDFAKATQLNPNVGQAPPMSAWLTIVQQHFYNASLFRLLLELAAVLYVLFRLLGLSGLYDWYLNRQFVKRSNFRRWAERSFSSRFVSEKKIADRVQMLDTERLLWGLKLGDHTVKAKRLIAAELQRRGIRDVQLSSWIPQAAQITSVSGASVPSSSTQYEHLARRRRRLFRAYRLFAFPLFALLALSSCSTTDDSRMLWFEPFGSELGHVPLIPGAINVAIVLVCLVYLVVR